jgi:hypothetical protein
VISVAHAKCLTCRARVWREGDAVDHLGHLCPGCGGPLEPVSDLSELIGFRCLRARPRSLGRALPDRSQRISAEIRETIARHDAERQRRTDAGRQHGRDREPRDGQPRVS